jgi:large subunit ribosomal protein L25
MLTIETKPRAAGVPAADIRTTGNIPAVFYGPKEPATSITISLKDFTKVWKQAGESTIINLGGSTSAKEALIHEVSVHPLTGEAMHVDFYVFDKTKKLTATVPLHFIGVSPAEKAGANLIKVMHEIEMEVLPNELPSHIDVDISVLTDIDMHITISDLKLPASAEPTLSPDEIIITAAEAKEEVITNDAPTVAPQVLEAQAAAAAAAATAAKDSEKKGGEKK